MDSRRIRNLRNSFDRNIVDQQVDKIIETGRQFVDGVSGARPGKRRNSDFQGITTKSVKKVGKWVSEKVDLFFDEDNDLFDEREDFNYDRSNIKMFKRESTSISVSQPSSKRPLEALSLRQPRNVQINEQKKLPYAKETNIKDWPDEFDFKVDRWQRSSDKDSHLARLKDQESNEIIKLRNLPRSRRRRV